ncbi:hypothetical protein Y032_0118g775 [Ancylostoma ceylanicum]|nr:hypothetical protein Y032_0118g775 [Ancylostoma ceylanicum]
MFLTYSGPKGRDRGTGTLVVCCTSRGSGQEITTYRFSSASLPSRQLLRCSRQPECPRVIPPLVYDRLG